MERIKYITNKELLIEIDRSKKSYSYYVSPKYERFDAIVHDVSLITPKFLQATLQKRYELVAKQGSSVWGDQTNFTTEDLVFRVMTNEHIPSDPGRKRRLKISDEGQAKTPFPPYKHFIIVKGVPVEVGRSHWKGDLETGSFCLEHGRITNRLAIMFMLLVERYSKRGNWRGYCLEENHEILTQRGFIGIDEMNENDIVLSYHEGKLVWGDVKSIYRDDFDGEMFRLTMQGMDAIVTPGHRFITDKGPKMVEYLTEKDRVILMGDPVADGDGKYSDAFVELVGWAVTEGSYRWIENKTRSSYYSISIYQNEGMKADRIRDCLKRNNIKYSEYSETKDYCSASGKLCKNINVKFNLRKDTSIKITEVAPNRVLSMPFLLSLTETQRELLINTMVDADGWRVKPPYERHKGGHMRYSQKDKAHLDAFLVLCTMNGHRTTTRIQQPTSNHLVQNATEYYSVNIYSKTNDVHKVSQVEHIDFHGGKRNGREYPGRGKIYHPNVPTYKYKGRVWCPETEFGTIMVRHNGTICCHANSYNDEMRSHAILQLSQVGLQFDESKSDNPFSFYTQVIKNSFTRILNVERKNQHIRDDLLVIGGVQPSYTRQVDHEIEQRFADERITMNPEGEVPVLTTVIELPKKRGRKPKQTSSNSISLDFAI